MALEIYLLSTSGSCERYDLSREGRMFCHEVFLRMYLPLTLEVYSIPLFDSLGFMPVDEIKKHLFGLISQIYSPWPLFLPEPKS